MVLFYCKESNKVCYLLVYVIKFKHIKTLGGRECVLQHKKEVRKYVA